MNNKRKNRSLLATLLFFNFLLTACSIHDNYIDCPRPYKLLIKAVNADGEDITENNDVNQVTLFIFNDMQHIEKVHTLTSEQIKNRQPIEINFNTTENFQSLTFVALGNTDNNVEFPASSTVKEWSELYVKLKSQNGVAQSPGAIFYGNLTVPLEFGNQDEPGDDRTIEIKHRTAQISISAIKLQQWNQGKTGNYGFRLKESFDTIDKDGNFTGNAVHFEPMATMDNGNLTTQVFNTFPQFSGNGYTLEILFNNEVIYSASTGSDGKPFTPQLGRMLNIIVDFQTETSNIDVLVEITPWNVVYQYVDLE